MVDLGVSAYRPNGAVFPVSGDGDGDGGDCHWSVVEEATAHVLRGVHPIPSSERKRAVVISYVQRLLICSLGCQVFPYGSVPLKTYLPDGDIDLTVLTHPKSEDALISDIFDVLKNEERNEHAEFEVKAVQLISAAEVKLVKCLILDIIVDISCNQLGGLCTLCFLEQIDRLIDKDHLFKRSIILIKAWCFYESRILGATHGLFSTYALEILVLYIFHIYHSSLKGPLSVLFRFLDYFSKFDWDNYCVSLYGPVCKSSLPDIVAHTPEVAKDSMLLSKQFLTNSTTMFKVPPRDLGKDPRPFQQKFINIIDPLKDDNNLGRSVNQGNSYRIRSALKFGARKLGEILALPTQSTGKELNKFFANTLAMHGGRHQASPRPSDSSYSSSFQSSDVDSSTGVRSPTGEVEGTSDSSSQASDASSYHAYRSIQAGRDETPLEGTKLGENLHDNGLLNSPRDMEVGVDRYGEAEGARLCGESKGVSNHCGDIHSIASGPKLCTARFSSGHQSWNFIDHNEISGPLEPLSDLTGDYESHLKSLFYGQSFHGNASILPMFYNLPVWDIQRQMLNFGQDHHYSQMKPNYGICGQPFRTVRGTGTYIPRTDLGSWRGERFPVKRGRRRVQGRSSPFQDYHHDRKFELAMIPVQANVTEQIYHQAELLESKQSTASPPCSAASILPEPEQSESFEFSSSEQLPEQKDEVDERSSDDNLEPVPSLKATTMLIPDQKLAEADEIQESVAAQPYHLKDEADFPPLASKITFRRSVSA